ncbi:RING-type domain-containing protein [Entamoeba marina]
MEESLRVCVNCDNKNGPVPFSFILKENETIHDLVERLKSEFATREINIDMFTGPVKVPINKPIHTLDVKTCELAIVNENEYKKLRDAPPKEYKQIVDKEKPRKPKKRKCNPPQMDGITIINDMSCHKCRQKRKWVYVCPNNEKHRFCIRCITEVQLEDMKENGKGCPICLGSCMCCLCKKKSA